MRNFKLKLGMSQNQLVFIKINILEMIFTQQKNSLITQDMLQKKPMKNVSNNYYLKIRMRILIRQYFSQKKFFQTLYKKNVQQRLLLSFFILKQNLSYQPISKRSLALVTCLKQKPVRQRNCAKLILLIYLILLQICMRWICKDVIS